MKQFHCQWLMLLAVGAVVCVFIGVSANHTIDNYSYECVTFLECKG